MSDEIIRQTCFLCQTPDRPKLPLRIIQSCLNFFDRLNELLRRYFDLLRNVSCNFYRFGIHGSFIYRTRGAVKNYAAAPAAAISAISWVIAAWRAWL